MFQDKKKQGASSSDSDTSKKGVVHYIGIVAIEVLRFILLDVEFHYLGSRLES